MIVIGLSMVQLHPQLRQDTFDICKFELCHILLLNDNRFPWLVLVPDRPEMTEFHNLDKADQRQLMKEMSQCAKTLEQLHKPDKINMGALGNLVPQLHIHVIARFQNDVAWPGPVWGFEKPQRYIPSALENALTTLRNHFKKTNPA